MKYLNYLIFGCFLFSPMVGFTQVEKPPVPDGTQGEVFRPKDTDSTGKEIPSMRLNEWDGPLCSMKFGGGILYEYAGFVQDDIAKEQVKAESNFKLRDARFTLSGKFKTKREITFKMGIMYDGNDKSWYMRETGILIKMPEMSGHIFIGRTKEGYSLSKIMVGYAIWNTERLAAIDIIPILADGIKYMGYLPKQRILWNVGGFIDWISDTQAFSTFEYQGSGRIAYLPFYSGIYKTVLHIGGNYRYGKVKDGQLKVRSKPEVSGGPYFVDSGTMNVDYTNSVGGELYYRSGRFLFGSEFHAHMMHSPENDNPVFKGGEAFVAWTFTGEVKPYYTSSGIFGFIKVKRSVFDGGFGAWEGILRFSNLDLQDQLVTGGDFWRITPALNWFLSNNIKLFLSYGYCVLNRYEKEGTTNIFQARMMFSL